MPSSRLGRVAAYLYFLILLAGCVGFNVFLSYRLTQPERALRVRIVLSPFVPNPHGPAPEELQARVTAAGQVLREAAGIHLKFEGFTNLAVTSEFDDPEALRRFIEDRVPRDDSDVSIAFWPAPAFDTRMGSAPPFSPVAVVRADSGSAVYDRAAVLHQIVSLFGVPDSADPQSAMHAAPTALRLDSGSAAMLNDTRFFDFTKGLAGMNRETQGHILGSLARQGYGTGTRNPPRLRLAELLLRDGRTAAAVEQYRAVLRSDPENTVARIRLAHALSLNGDFADAEKEAREAVRRAPEDNDAHYELGFVLVRASNPEPAVAELRKAIAIAPKSARNHAGLAVAYAAALGDFDGAGAEFKAAGRLDPNDPALLADEEFVRRLRANWEGQEAAARDLVAVHPSGASERNGLATALLHLGKADEAVEQAREAVKAAPEIWQTHYTLAVALYAKRELDEAAAELAEAKKLGAGERPQLEESLRAARAEKSLPRR